MNYKLVNYLWDVLFALEQKHGKSENEARIDIEPLKWYLETGRCTADFQNRLLATKPYLVARRLAGKGYGDYSIPLDAIKHLLGV